jgi:UDP-N-acetylglucosamine--N-acetylmuramyl-(pentapeptide) pyrophosphoryl-undecaprenol N-acetylglucosamine transferase
MAARLPLRIILSGGGTGGHVYPAIAIADALKELPYDVEILFVGANGKVEMKRVPEAGYSIVGLPVRGIQPGFSMANLLFPFRLLISFVKVYKVLKSFSPDAVIGLGGFASGPCLKMAQWMGTPTYLQEQNAAPGKTNRLLAKKVKAAFVAYPNMQQYFTETSLEITGNPIRSTVDPSISKEEACEYFDLDSTRPIVFMTGGSLGAQTLNDSMALALPVFQEKGIQVLWQSGSYYYERFKAHHGEGVKVMAYVDRMDLAYLAADVIVARAGASTISELALIAKPSVLIPSPNVTEDHQNKNAQAMVDARAILKISDEDARDKMGHEVIHLLEDRMRQEELSITLEQFAKPYAAHDIVQYIVKECNLPHYLHQHDLTQVRHIYFIGIGGAGMNTLAHYFLNQGVDVSGYDRKATSITQHLETRGARIGYTLDDVIPASVDLVVYTPAISKDNPVFLQAIQRKSISLLKRSECLGLLTQNRTTIAVAGSHGKTTITSMIAHIFLANSKPITGFIGGQFVGQEGGLVGDGDIFLVEADEFDRSFLHLRPDTAVISTIDADHLEIYGDLQGVQRGFECFIRRIASDGHLILGPDVSIPRSCNPSLSRVTYGSSSRGDWRLSKAQWDGDAFTYVFTAGGKEYSGKLPLGGIHNVKNAIASIAVAQSHNLSIESTIDALSTFPGVKRRFQVITGGKGWTYIDDYAHHPSEITALIHGLRSMEPNWPVVVIFQPHLFTRTQMLAKEFGEALSAADQVILLPIYPAREEPIEGVTSALVADHVTVSCRTLQHDKEEVLSLLDTLPKGFVVSAGAGDISALIPSIQQKLDLTYGKA